MNHPSINPLCSFVFPIISSSSIFHATSPLLQRSQIVKLVEQAVKELLPKLTQSKIQYKSYGAEDEAKRLFAEGLSDRKVGLYQQSRECFLAAWALGLRTKEVKNEELWAYSLETFPVKICHEDSWWEISSLSRTEKHATLLPSTIRLMEYLDEIIQSTDRYENAEIEAFGVGAFMLFYGHYHRLNTKDPEKYQELLTLVRKIYKELRRDTKSPRLEVISLVYAGYLSESPVEALKSIKDVLSRYTSPPTHLIWVLEKMIVLNNPDFSRPPTFDPYASRAKANAGSNTPAGELQVGDAIQCGNDLSAWLMNREDIEFQFVGLRISCNLSKSQTKTQKEERLNGFIWDNREVIQGLMARKWAQKSGSCLSEHFRIKKIDLKIVEYFSNTVSFSSYAMFNRITSHLEEYSSSEIERAAVAVKSLSEAYVKKTNEDATFLKEYSEKLRSAHSSTPTSEIFLNNFIPLNTNPSSKLINASTVSSGKKYYGINIYADFIQISILNDQNSPKPLIIPNEGVIRTDSLFDSPFLELSDDRVAFAYHQDLYICDLMRQSWKKYQLHLNTCDSLLLDKDILYLGEANWSHHLSPKYITASVFSTLNLSTGEQKVIFSNYAKSPESPLNNCRPQSIWRIFKKNDNALILYAIKGLDQSNADDEHVFYDFNISSNEIVKQSPIRTAKRNCQGKDCILFYRPNHEVFAFNPLSGKWRNLLKVASNDSSIPFLWTQPARMIEESVASMYFNGEELFIFENISSIHLRNGPHQDRVWVFQKNQLAPTLINLKYDRNFSSDDFISNREGSVLFTEEGIYSSKGTYRSKGNLGYYFVPFTRIYELLKNGPAQNSHTLSMDEE